jgi:hypothetical protein
MLDQSKMISRCSSKVSSEHMNVTLNRSLKQVKFQEIPQTIIYIPSFEGVGHSQASLQQMRDVALDTALQARYDLRYTLWNTLFQDPASENLLCLWTTNSNTLRGLERFVCNTLRRKRILEHTEQVLAILQAQRRYYKRRRRQQRKQRLGIEEELDQDFSTCESENEAEELAAISRRYSHNSIEMALAIGKADAFAVSVDDHKCSSSDWIQNQVVSNYTGNQGMTDQSKNSFPNSSAGSSCLMTSRTTSTAA